VLGEIEVRRQNSEESSKYQIPNSIGRPDEATVNWQETQIDS